MERPIIDYIRRPDSMDAQSIEHLRALTTQYPYFHSARILLLQALYRLHDPAFNNELRTASLMVPNRQAIFHLVEEKNYSVEEERKKFAKDSFDEREDATANLIDQFLGTLPQEQTPSSPLPVDATQDYIGYLLQTESAHEDEAVGSMTPGAAEEPEANSQLPVEAPQLKGGDIIDDFLESGTTRITLSAEEPASTPEAPVQKEVEEEPQSGGFLTEALAGIYIKQGKYENAAKIIRQIYLNNPKKSRYFADQLRFLEKLIINNKNK